MADRPHPISAYPAALAFVALICLPLVFLGRPALLGSALAENREPKAFPSTWSIRYLERVSDFYNDNLGFRSALVGLGSRVMVGLGVNSTQPTVVVGSGGWLFYSDDSSDRGRATMKDFRGRNPFSPEQLAAIRGNFETIGRAFGQCGIRFLLWTIPNKQTVYGEHLAGFRQAKSPRRIDQLEEALRGTVQIADARGALLAAKSRSDGLDLYFRTDTHWNALGAFVAYAALLDDLSPAMHLPRRDNADPARYDIEVSPFSGGDLAANMLNAGWRFPDVKPELAPRFARTARETSSPGSDYAWRNPGVSGSMAMYGDSFAPFVIPYLQEHFGRGVLLPGHVVDGEALRDLRPDLVVLEIVERHLDLLAEPSRNLDKLCP